MAWQNEAAGPTSTARANNAHAPAKPPPHTDAILAIARPLRRVAETYVQHDPTCPAARAWHELALACDMLEQIATQIADYLDDPPRKP